MSEKETNLLLNLIEDKIKTQDGYLSVLSKIKDARMKHFVTQLRGALIAKDDCGYEFWARAILVELENTELNNIDSNVSFNR